MSSGNDRYYWVVHSFLISPSIRRYLSLSQSNMRIGVESLQSYEHQAPDQKMVVGKRKKIKASHTLFVKGNEWHSFSSVISKCFSIPADSRLSLPSCSCSRHEWQNNCSICVCVMQSNVNVLSRKTSVLLFFCRTVHPNVGLDVYLNIR